jgi:short-subunit dehydrogenase
MNENNNRGKYALVTGATSGFGFEFARLLAKDGYNLVLVARTGERLDEIATDLTQTFFIEVLPITADLFNPSSAKDIYEEIITKGITIDILINDAGQSEHGNFIEYDMARDIDLIQLNITSVVCLTKLFLKDMVARNEGKILQVASLLGKYPTPLMTVYAATKAFIISFTEGLINELQETQVTVTALMPGASDTDFFHKAGTENTVTYREEKLSNPEDVAREGYEGLMSGDNKVVVGAKNKMYAAMSNLMPDGMLASTMRKKMAPSDEAEGRDHITHGPSIEERDQIERTTGKEDGDYEEHEDHIHNQ